MVYFVGAGTGAVDLITVRGMRLIESADVIIYAGSLVNPEILNYAKETCIIYNSAKMTLEEVAEVMKESEKAGYVTVRLHTGDPSVYGAVREQMDILEYLDIKYESCPGVSACFGAAASMNMEYTLPGVSQSLIITRMEGRTSVPEKESIESFAAHETSMAVYLSTGMTGELSRRLIAGGYKEDTPAAIVYKATWPDEKILICTVGQLEETADKYHIRKTALIIVGDAVKKSGYQRSKLYDPDFETQYRQESNAKKGIGVISFTKKGRELSVKLRQQLGKESGVVLYNKSQAYKKSEDEVIAYTDSLVSWAAEHMNEEKPMIFIGACAIAVRAIAPVLKDKLKDAPVLVMDEAGRYVIPILSGHYGGANGLASKVAKSLFEVTGAQAVVTTATDINRLFAVDVFARRNHLAIVNREGIKKIAADILAEQKVTMQIDGAFAGNVPSEIVLIEIDESPKVDILISIFRKDKTEAVLRLCPKVVVLGIGCRKGTSKEALDYEISRQLKEWDIREEAVALLASIDVKKDEAGLLELAKDRHWEFQTFSKEELEVVEGDYSGSAFVKQTVGVDNVCERSAMAACRAKGRLVFKKQAGNGITIAAAMVSWRVIFDEE